MEDVELIYHNDLGIAFKWKQNVPNTDSRRIQMVFKYMVFYLLPCEIRNFSHNIKSARYYNCDNCPKNRNCRNILLSAPLDKMNFKVSFAELEQIKDLVEGALFKINLEDHLNGCGRN